MYKMKTEIVYRHDLEEGFIIYKVIPIDSKNCAVMYAKYPSILKIDIVGEQPKTFTISDIKGLSEGVAGKSLFRYNETLGLIDYTDTILLWNDINKPELLKIINPFPADKYNRKYHTTISTFDDNGKSLYFGMEEKSRHGFPARFWAKLDLKENSVFGFKLFKNGIKWNPENELNLNDYPSTEFGKYGDDWLNINDLMMKDEHLYIHTNGGATTRLKSGKAFEFSIISKLTTDNQHIRSFNIGEGKGYFSSSKKHFILHNRKNKKKISLYNTNNFEIDFEISLTPKQNLADGSSNFLVIDSFDENLYLYNANFFNICKIIK